MPKEVNLPFIWSADVIQAGLIEIGRIRRTLLLHLKSLLDAYHYVERPAEYYDLLAGEWLEHFIHHVYAAWQQVLAGDVPDDATPIPLATDLRHAEMRYMDVNWHKHLRWAVEHCLDGNLRADSYVTPMSVHFTIGSRTRPTRSLLRSFATSRPKVLLTKPYFKCEKREWIGALWRWRRWLAWDDLEYPIRVDTTVNWKWRRDQSSEAGPASGIATLVKALMPLYLPVVLLEGFEDYRASVLALPLSRPQAIYSATALHGHLSFKLLTAEWRQEGTLLLYHQHGGGYGLEHLQVSEEYESRVADRFYSWGWRRDDRLVYPLSPPMLPAYNGRRRHRILLVCLDMPSVPYRLQFTPMPGTIEKMHGNTIDFISALPDRKNLLIRPYHHDYGYGAVAKMREAAPDAEFDTNQTMALVRFAESRLVVHNYVGTGILETLFLNIPTVCFYDPNTYRFPEAAQSWIDSLARVGIFHHSGKAAARFVAGLANDPEGWWAKPEVQEVRRNFVQQYANFSPDWKEQWEQEFESVLVHA